MEKNLKILFSGHNSGAYSAFKHLLNSDNYIINGVVLRVESKDEDIYNLSISKNIKTFLPEKFS